MARAKLKKSSGVALARMDKLGDLTNALPPELLARIFEVGLEIEADDENAWEDEDDSSDSDSDDDDDDKLKLPFHILVASVCKHWRQVALATTTLWTTIGIGLAHGAIHIDLVREMLDRSKGAPLTLSVDVEDVRLSDDEDVSPEDLPLDDALRLSLACFELFMSHAYHWRTFEVSFEGEATEFLSHFLPLLYAAPGAPLLEQLGVYVADPSFDEDEPQPPSPIPPVSGSLFGGARPPRLSKTTLWGAPLGWGPLVREVILTDLVILELGLFFADCAPSLDDFFAVLRSNPALERLELNHCAPVATEWPLALEANIVELPRLRELCFIGLASAVMRKLVELVNAPGVADLRIELDPAAVADHAAFFERLVAPRVLFPALTRLRIDGADDADALRRLFLALTAVDELSLDAAAVDLLRYDGGAGDDATVLRSIPLPKLLRLSLRCSEPGAELPSLVEVLRTRQAALCPVRNLFIQDTIVPPEEDELRRYVETVDFFADSEEEDDDEDEWEDSELDEDALEGGVEIFEDDLDDDEEDESDDDLDLLSSQFQASTL